jgi:hypothetical protein
VLLLSMPTKTGGGGVTSNPHNTKKIDKSSLQQTIWRYFPTLRLFRGGLGAVRVPSHKFRKQCKFRQILGKMKKIRADLSENRLNSGLFITIFHKTFGQTFNCPPPLGKRQPCTPIPSHAPSAIRNLIKNHNILLFIHFIILQRS